MINNEVDGERSDLAPETQLVTCVHRRPEWTLVIMRRQQHSQRSGSFDRERRHIKQSDVRNRLFTHTERISKTIARKRRDTHFRHGRGERKAKRAGFTMDVIARKQSTCNERPAQTNGVTGEWMLHMLRGRRSNLRPFEGGSGL